MKRKQTLKRATKTERDVARAAYAGHVRACASHGLTPAPFDAFFHEFLESSRIGGGTAQSADECLYEGHGRDYERMFWQKKGWD